MIRGTTVYVQGESLELAEESIETAICTGPVKNEFIELDRVYSGSQSGRRLTVFGERTDITVPDSTDSNQTVTLMGISSTELVMLAEVIQDVVKEGKVLEYIKVKIHLASSSWMRKGCLATSTYMDPACRKT